ncbi:MAG: AtpZ/AtpI family protein [Dehalococcoidia bacterium]|nr:AtpZ/AtpI family protein [Dehalococcoidia bacterium]
MNRPSANKSAPGDTPLGRQVGAKEERKMKARSRTEHSIWFGLGMFGLVGWSVVVPILVGIALGVWLDQHHPGSYSWTLTLLILGLVMGCLSAWHWLSKEYKEMLDEQEERHE